MQDFALKISRRHAPKPPRKFGLLSWHGLNGKVEIWKGK
jgi:hypothetical protein